MIISPLQDEARRGVLVTGSSGFIGRPLVKALREKGFHVIEGTSDLLNGKTKPDVDIQSLIHLSGIASVEVAQRDPDLAFKINVENTFKWLKLAREWQISSFIFASSGLLYGPNNSKPASEADPVFPENSIYSATKLAAENLVLGFSKSYLKNGIILRMSNVYGPGSKANTFIGSLTEQLISKKSAELRCQEPIRDFLYVEDVVTGFERLLRCCQNKKGVPAILNLSSGLPLSLGDVAKNACQILGLDPSTSVRWTEKTSPNEFVLNNRLFSETTGWKPETLIQQGLKRMLYV